MVAAFNNRNNVVVDLNSKSLNMTDGNSIVFDGDKNLTFRNGNISANNYADGTKAVFNPQKDASITLENVKMVTNGSALFPQGNAAEVNVINSEITAGTYVVGTNANSRDYYGVIINISGSKLESTYWQNATDGDGCTVTINVEGELNIKDSTLIGPRQVLFVRAGTAKVENTEIIYSAKYSNLSQYNNSNWGSGTEAPSAPIVVGNRNETSYNADAVLTLTNCTIEGSNDQLVSGQNVMIYTYGNSRYKAYLNYDEFNEENLFKGPYTVINDVATNDSSNETENTENSIVDNSENVDEVTNSNPDIESPDVDDALGAPAEEQEADQSASGEVVTE